VAEAGLLGVGPNFAGNLYAPRASRWKGCTWRPASRCCWKIELEGPFKVGAVSPRDFSCLIQTRRLLAETGAAHPCARGTDSAAAIERSGLQRARLELQAEREFDAVLGTGDLGQALDRTEAQLAWPQAEVGPFATKKAAPKSRGSKGKDWGRSCRNAGPDKTGPDIKSKTISSFKKKTQPNVHRGTFFLQAKGLEGKKVCKHRTFAERFAS